MARRFRVYVYVDLMARDAIDAAEKAKTELRAGGYDGLDVFKVDAHGRVLDPGLAAMSARNARTPGSR